MSERRRRLFLLVAFSLAAAAASPRVASAQTGARASDVAETDALFKRGLEQYDAGDNAGAIATWERLLTLLDEERAWKLLFNLGLAYQAAGDATHAVERFEGFLHKLSEQPSRPKPDLEARRLEVVERVRKIKATHGAVRLLAHPSRDVLVKVDQAAPRATGFTAYLLPGDHVVEVQPGTPQVRRIPVRSVAAMTVDVDTAEPPVAPPSAVAPPAVALPPRTEPARVEPRILRTQTARPAERAFPTGWLIAGALVTAASVALPIGLGLAARSKRGDALALGPGHTGYRATVDDFQHARTLYEVSWAVPAALATATIIVVLVAARSEDRGKAVARLLEAPWTPGAL